MVILALVGGLALMFRRAPTDSIGSWREWSSLGARNGDANPMDHLPSGIANSLNDDATGSSSQQPIEVAIAGNGARTALPLVRKARSPGTESRAIRATKASRSAVTGGFKLPPLSLLDMPAARACADR